MTLGEAEEIFRYWGMHPPAHLLLAALCGIKSKAAPQMGAGLPPGIAIGEPGGLDMPPPEFDLDEMRTKNRARAAAAARRNAAARHSTGLSGEAKTA